MFWEIVKTAPCIGLSLCSQKSSEFYVFLFVFFFIFVRPSSFYRKSWLLFLVPNYLSCSWHIRNGSDVLTDILNITFQYHKISLACPEVISPISSNFLFVLSAICGFMCVLFKILLFLSVAYFSIHLQTLRNFLLGTFYDMKWRVIEFSSFSFVSES